MKFGDFYKKVLFYATVPKCVCCQEKLNKSDVALCNKCYAEYLDHKSRGVCSVCFKPLYECSCTNDYLERHYVHKLVKVFRYKSTPNGNEVLPQNELIYNLKRGYRRDTVSFLSQEMAEAISFSVKVDPNKFIITSVPRQRKRRLKYGVDHSKEIAKGVGKLLGIKYVDILKSKSKMAQKKTKGEARLENAVFAYKSNEDLKGKTVIIFDDIVTTGASLGACAALTKGLGAKSIIGATFFIAYKDPYVPVIMD